MLFPFVTLPVLYHVLPFCRPAFGIMNLMYHQIKAIPEKQSGERKEQLK